MGFGPAGGGGSGSSSGSGVNPLGAWVTATVYAVNDQVGNGGDLFLCTVAHTSGALTEPGVGGSWATVWSNWVDMLSATAKAAIEANTDLSAENPVADQADERFTDDRDPTEHSSSVHSDTVAVASNEKIRRFATVALANVATNVGGDLCWVDENDAQYKYYVGLDAAIDGTMVLQANTSGADRWIACGGNYIWPNNLLASRIDTDTLYVTDTITLENSDTLSWIAGSSESGWVLTTDGKKVILYAKVNA